jgi:exosortase E/protease (VPEID-CTERM system)
VPVKRAPARRHVHSGCVSAPTRPWLLGLWPLGLLLLEYLAVSLHFDAQPLAEAAGFARGSAYLGLFAPLCLAVATATFMLSGRALRSELREYLQQVPLLGPARRIGLAVNAGCYASLWWQLGALFGRIETQRGISAGELAMPLCVAGVSALSLLWSALPWRLVLRARTAGLLALGLGVGALAWGAGLWTAQLWERLQSLTLHTVLWMMLPFANTIVFDPEAAVIGTDDFMVEVAPECSGIEGIGLITVVIGVYLISARERLRFPRALWLVPIAVAAVWLGNALRIAALIGVGATISPEVALSGFHSKAGWLFFCGVALGLIALVQRSAWFSKLPAAGPQAPTWSPAATYLSPLLALIATSLTTALFSTGFDAWYGLRILAVAAALFAQREHLPRPNWPVSWHAPAIGSAVFVLWLWLVPGGSADHVAEFRQDIAELGRPWSGVWLALRALGSVIAVPIAEELAFRGFLLRRLIDRDFSTVDNARLTPLALALSSLAFGLLHAGAVGAATLAGVAYALAQRQRGRIGDAIVAHAVTNAWIALDVLFRDAYGLWL